ncbi:hypothetical protein GBF35_45955 [Nonomuraea phyllanthi]|uniref:hypothetical protein n=1 Tax=Nonomuraea phyllanthi TaxID=2219224 RepID=UPI0012940824|nr:hypothetical protein [Nonomuraea phyllanthi]QFY12934.1 hypothetical protein GBF35_45955 [Nonomuraea phyllanthi]
MNDRHLPDPPSLHALVRQQQWLNKDATSSVATRLAHGHRISGQELCTALRANFLLHWWSLLARHGEQHGLGMARAMAKFSFWISCYRSQDPGDLPTFAGGDGLTEEELALAHLDRALELIKRAAAREFLGTATESGSTGKERAQ